MLILNLQGKKIGFCLTGSFCTFKTTIEQMKEIVKLGGDVLPIMSFNAYNINSKFGNAKQFIEEIENITGKKIICSIKDAEPIGPKKMTDIMIIAPCSGNTIGKLANGINDTPVLMAAKSHLRNENPLVIAISTNDALSRKCEELLFCTI